MQGYSDGVQGEVGDGAMTKAYGIVISLLVHALILLIPISMPHSGSSTDEIEMSIVKVPVLAEVRRGLQEAREIKKKVPEARVMQKERPEIAESGKEPLLKTAGESPTNTMEHAPVDTVKSGMATTPAEEAEESPKRDVSNPDIRPYVTTFGSADGPKFLKRVTPKYPPLARRLGVEGRVVLRLTIDEEGRLIDVRVVERAGFGFDREALEAVKRSTFLPAMRNGTPVRSEVLLPVRFVLKKEAHVDDRSLP